MERVQLLEIRGSSGNYISRFNILCSNALWPYNPKDKYECSWFRIEFSDDYFECGDEHSDSIEEDF
jgi:hypothetical protein